MIEKKFRMLNIPSFSGFPKKVFYSIPFYFFIACCVWLYCFQGWLTGRLALTSDAMAYYEHIEVLVVNISRGIYPLWDPTIQTGVPTEFFMRRIGSFNPVYLALAVLYRLDIPFQWIYLWFLPCYYFLGVWGFFLFCRKIFSDSTVAFLAALLVMFSSLGTRLFDSYIILSFVPIVWFFYFLLSFCLKPNRISCLGATFTVMILLTTYIPFYFVTIVWVALLSFLLIYFSKVGGILKKIWNFAVKNKFFTFLCVLALLLSFTPGVLYFQEMGKGLIFMSERNAKADQGHVLSVDESTITKWGAYEDITYSSYFQDLRDFKFAVWYYPGFFYILLLLILFTRVRRQFLFWALLGIIIFLISSPEMIGLYQFLHDHIFYFKFFRNLHFFLWLVILPVIVVLAVGQVQRLWQYQPQRKIEKYLLWGYTLVVHIGLIVFVLHERNGIITTFLVLGISCIFFLLYFTKKIQYKSPVFLCSILLLVLLQPIEVYHYLDKNAGLNFGRYGYKLERQPFLSLSLPTDEFVNKFLASKQEPEFLQENLPNLYFGLKLYDRLMKNINYNVVQDYFVNKFIVYDRAQNIDPNQTDYKRLEQNLDAYENLAYVYLPAGTKNAGQVEQGSGQHSAQATIVSSQDKNVEVLRLGMNFLKVRTSFKQRKFFVYNDSYYPGWEIFVNGQKAELFVAQLMSKGVWLPAGENTVVFRFGPMWRYYLNYFFLFLFNFVFYYLIYLVYQKTVKGKKIS